MKKRVTLMLIALVWLAGCGHTVQRYNSSAVDYLYPEKDGFVEKNRPPASSPAHYGGGRFCSRQPGVEKQSSNGNVGWRNRPGRSVRAV